MVVQYQSDGQQATCKSITDDQDLELYWLDHHGKMSGTSWLVKTYDSFDLKPYCVAASKHDSSKCVEPLNVIVYSRFCLFALCGHLVFILTIHSLL